MNRLRELHRSGTSVWLDTLSRELLDDGTLDAHIAECSITGVTCNPSIFAGAPRELARYDADLARLSADGTVGARELYLELALSDAQAAARKLHPVFRSSNGRDGHVSFECTPEVADDAAATIAQAERIRRLVPEPNLMIGVPGTEAGMTAIEELTARGINVNVTLLFALDRWEQAARAYQRGLRQRHDAGLALDAIRSVASVFVSPIDARVERELGGEEPSDGAAAIAQAQRIHDGAQHMFAAREWESLSAAGAHPQRLLWVSTAPKSPAYRDVVYVERLAFPETIVTIPERILSAFADHGEIGRATADIGGANATASTLRMLGIDLDVIGVHLLDEGLAASGRYYARALDNLRTRAHRAVVVPDLASVA